MCSLQTVPYCKVSPPVSTRNNHANADSGSDRMRETTAETRRHAAPELAEMRTALERTDYRLTQRTPMEQRPKLIPILDIGISQPRLEFMLELSLWEGGGIQCSRAECREWRGLWCRGVSRATVPGPPSLGDGARLSVSPAPSPRETPDRASLSGRDGAAWAAWALLSAQWKPSVIGTWDRALNTQRAHGSLAQTLKK